MINRLRRPRRAVVLVLVLWVLVILLLIVYSLLFQSSTETTMTSMRKKSLRAEALARAGMARAVVDLRNDLIFDTGEEGKRFDAEGDVWSRPEEGKLDAYPDARGEGDEESGFYNTRVYDEQGYFNLNRFSPANVILLEKIIQRIGYTEEDSKIVAAAIIDWRDADQVPALTESASNEEGIAYAVLRGVDEGTEEDPDEVEPMVFRNEDFLTVDELLEVYGVTPDLFFGPGTPEAEYYKALIPQPQGERFQIEDAPKRRRSLDEPVYGLRDYFTTYGDGTLNFNTAPAHVLAALAEGGGNPDGEDWGIRMVERRRGNRDDDIDNDNAYDDMTKLQGDIDAGGVIASAGNLHPVGVATTVFRIVSVGEYQGVKCRIVAYATRSLATLTRDESFEISERAEERRERNSARTERRTDQNDDRVVRYPIVRIMQMQID